MSLTATVRQKNNIKSLSLERNYPFQDKRRLLSYWKSLDSPTTPDKEEDGVDDVKDGLLDELKKCLTEMDDCVSDVVGAETETSYLQNEQLSLLKQLGDYVQHFIKEKSDLDLNDNLQSEKDENKHFDALKAERRLLLEENENLVKQVEAQSDEFKSSSKEQQRDIEKLTREIQSSNISRKRLERELLHATKLKDENEATINSLRQELQTMRESYDSEVQKLSSINEQVSKDNSELVEKGREATESLKVALQQLTDEKKAMQEQTKSVSGKEAWELEASLERAKKERETFRQRCEKSEMLQRNLQEEITSLRNQLKVKEDGTTTEGSNFVGEDDSNVERVLESAQCRISQLKNYVHVLEDRVKEKEESILSLRKENARSNDVVMEKSLELSRTRRILERKIEKLAKENSEWKRKCLIPNSYDRSVENQQLDAINVQTRSKQQQQQQQQQQHLQQQHQQQQQQLQQPFSGPRAEVENLKTVRTKGFLVEDRHRRRSNPERSAIQTTLNRLNNVIISDTAMQQQQQLLLLPTNGNIKPDETHSATNNHVPNEKYFSKEGQDSVFTPVEVRALDVAPRRRIGGKFIRASSKRHSADLGKLMSRQESAAGRKSDSDLLRRDEPATIFVNKYRKKSEEEEHWV